MDKFKHDLFIDGTFFIAPKKMSYQMLVICVNDDLRNTSFMTSWSFLSGKSSDDYLTALKEINKNVLKFQEMIIIIQNIAILIMKLQFGLLVKKYGKKLK